MSKKKIGVFGYARHGKDTFAEILAEKLGYKFCSSSLFVCEKAVFPTLSKLYGYKTIEEAYEDRVNHRPEWKELITQYNFPDKSKLAIELFKEYDIYVGMRCDIELKTCLSKGIFDIIIWVDNSRVLPEPEASCPIRRENFQWDVFVPNYFSLEYLEWQASLLIAEGVFE